MELGRRIFIADVHCDDGKRYVVQADEKLTAFMELEAAICAKRFWLQPLPKCSRGLRHAGQGRGAGVGRGLGVGEHLPVQGVGDGVGVGVADGVGVGVGPPVVSCVTKNRCSVPRGPTKIIS